MAVISSDILTIDSSSTEPTVDQMSYVASLTWLPSLTWGAPGLSWTGVADPRRLKSWLIRQKPAHIGIYDEDGEPIGYAAVLREVRDVTDYEDSEETVTLAYEASIAFGMAAGDAATAAVVFGGVSTANKPARAWLSTDEIEFPDGEVRVGETAMTFSLQKTIRERITINLTI